jgi:hypothetical protein
MPYLQAQHRHSYDINLEVDIIPESNGRPTTVTRSNFKHL